MVAKRDPWPRSVELEQAIKHRIVQRTGGRIQALEVEVIGERVVIRGRTASFHLKQLALQGVFDAIGSAGTTRIELNVQVEERSSDAEDT